MFARNPHRQYQRCRHGVLFTWWHHQMETFSALLAVCAGKSPGTRPVTRSFDVFFDLRLNKRLSKQWRGWWFETLSRPLWRHRNAVFSIDAYTHVCCWGYPRRSIFFHLSCVALWSFQSLDHTSARPKDVNFFFTPSFQAYRDSRKPLALLSPSNKATVSAG